MLPGMNSFQQLSDKLRCPDDLGDLTITHQGIRCSSCGRQFPCVNGVPELLPNESLQEGSAECTQLESYRASFSNRPERPWLQPAKTFINVLGNGYLYRWAASTICWIAAERALTILDAACGEGVTKIFLPRRHSYAGVDFSSRSLLRAQRYHPAPYFRSDLNYLPFAPATFDVVVCLQALQYLQHPETALRQMARVLKPGGMLVMTVPNYQSFKYRHQGLPSLQLQRFDRGIIHNLLSQDFQIQAIETRGIWIPIPTISIHAPGRVSDRWGLSWTVVASAKNKA